MREGNAGRELTEHGRGLRPGFHGLLEEDETPSGAAVVSVRSDPARSGLLWIINPDSGDCGLCLFRENLDWNGLRPPG
ncbi:hypothetical protein CRG98_004192 [Punica granatum]|uniref:Uncharacterized protein n=1 Tax=Punica granatum TaxID=22663 RepID=A0A2I0L441_PUNGR|nr:hypothetical protein CRG98_004192 [Punica granatum]